MGVGVVVVVLVVMEVGAAGVTSGEIVTATGGVKGC